MLMLEADGVLVVRSSLLSLVELEVLHTPVATPSWRVEGPVWQGYGQKQGAKGQGGGGAETR